MRYIVFEMKNAVAFCYNSVNLKEKCGGYVIISGKQIKRMKRVSVDTQIIIIDYSKESTVYKLYYEMPESLIGVSCVAWSRMKNISV